MLPGRYMVQRYFCRHGSNPVALFADLVSVQKSSILQLLAFFPRYLFHRPRSEAAVLFSALPRSCDGTITLLLEIRDAGKNDPQVSTRAVVIRAVNQPQFTNQGTPPALLPHPCSTHYQPPLPTLVSPHHVLAGVIGNSWGEIMKFVSTFGTQQERRFSGSTKILHNPGPGLSLLRGRQKGEGTGILRVTRNI